MRSDLHAAASDYLAMRRALGFKLRGYDRLLTGFIEFLTAAGVSTPTTMLAVDWAPAPSDRVQPVRCAQRLSVVRGFARYLHGLDATVQVPPQDLLSSPPGPQARVPQCRARRQARRRRERHPRSRREARP